MILCVTLNPCLDKTLDVPDWNPGDSVRGSALKEVVGGKGNNVARALLRLGWPQVRPLTFLGGALGDWCEHLLREQDGFDPLIIRVRAPSRVILTVRTGSPNLQTAFFDPDPQITDDDATILIEQAEALLCQGLVQALSLSGSSPAPATHRVFAKLIASARTHQVPVFVDTYGPALEAISAAWPNVLQVNRREAGLLLRTNAPTQADVHALLDNWTHRGVTCGVVTNGDEPADVCWNGEKLRLFPPLVKVVNPVGCGDCFLAGLIDGWLNGLKPDPLFRRAAACGAANALTWDAGLIEQKEVARLAESARIERV